jgi:hypothetical protein
MPELRRRIRPRVHGVVTLIVLVAITLSAGCANQAPVFATFMREWPDGRVETLEAREDGRVQMDHFGTIDRTTLSPEDVARLRASLANISPAADPDALPRLTLTPTGGAAVVVDPVPGTAGEYFLSLLERHELPST